MNELYFLKLYHHNRFFLKKVFFLFTIVLFASVNSFSQEVSIPQLVLNNINFPLKISGLPDTLNTLKLTLENEEVTLTYLLYAENGEVDTSFALNTTGNYTLKFSELNLPYSSIRVIPGLLSIIPPLLAIALALVFRQVIISLILGIFIGAFFIYDYNPLIGLVRVVDTYIIDAVNDKSHIQIIVFTFLFGGVIGIISKGGGTRGIANLLAKFARTRKSGMISAWLSGLVIFFDDYSNSLIVGNLMRPITDRLKISREKLSFIVDATAAPVASIFLISSWIGFEVGLIQDGLNAIGSTENAYDVFIQTIPYRFYPVAMLIFVFLIAFTKRDFGAMYKAEKRAAEENKIISDGALVSDDFYDTEEIFGKEERAKWYNGLIPLLILIFGTIAVLLYTGIQSLVEEGITDFGLKEIIGRADSYVALLWSSFIACFAAGLMILLQKILNLKEVIDAWFNGVRSMLLAIIILVLAWSIGSITQDVKTADYMVSIITDSISPRFLPVIIFITCALISFSTGTSFGTMAIIMPIVIPLSDAVTSLHNYSSADQTIILHGVISSVLAGSVFGDHCSPISDTTILSSLASRCDLMDHVRTQLPYAVLVAVVCMLIGDIPTAFGFPTYLSLIIIVGILTGVLFLIGKRVGN
jgi:Na+/H+ antiporter NhaC